jgi:regulator of RNase E activity RraB
VRKFTIFLFIFLVGGCATKVKDYSDNDSDLISALVNRGSDVNKEHLVSFIIDCSSKKQVSDIVSGAVQIGFEDDYISYSEKRKVWSTSLIKSLKLNLEQITTNRAQLTLLMPSNGCNPIGWGASVEL